MLRLLLPLLRLLHATRCHARPSLHSTPAGESTHGADHAHAATAAAAAQHAAKHAAQPAAPAAASKTAAAAAIAAAAALLPEAVHHAVGEAHELLARCLVGGVLTCVSKEQPSALNRQCSGGVSRLLLHGCQQKRTFDPADLDPERSGPAESFSIVKRR